MSGEPQLFRVNPDSRESERIEEVDFGQLGLRERRDIQEWVAANPGILGDDLLIIGKEFSGFDRTNERLDLLAVDSDGKLVVIELKRDDTGADAHWQAIKYASYLRRAGPAKIIDMLAAYREVSKEEAKNLLLERLDIDDTDALNNDQRIILASHRFAPEVTTAVVWLNEKAPGENLITCIKLTPYRDANTGSLYVQASTIIPVPGVDVIGIGDSIVTDTGSRRKALEQAKNDGSFAFIERVRTLALQGLPPPIRPDRVGGVRVRTQLRQSNLWYNRGPWHRATLYYSVRLRPAEETGKWQAGIWLRNKNKIPQLADLQGTHEGQTNHGDAIVVRVGPNILKDDFVNEVADVLRTFIEQITPIVDDLEDGDNELVDDIENESDEEE